LVNHHQQALRQQQQHINDMTSIDSINLIIASIIAAE